MILVANRPSLVWSAPLWALVLYASLVPLRLVPQFAIGDLPVYSVDIGIMAVALFYGIAFLAVPRTELRPLNWDRKLPLFGVSIMVFAAVSIHWSGLDRANSVAMAYTLVLALSSLLLGYWIVASLPAAHLDRLLLLLSLALAGIGAVYTAISLLGLGVRSEQGHSYSIGFGIERVMGPLFPSSIGRVVLLPASAFLIQDLVRTPRYRFVKVLGLLMLMATLFGTGSRAAALLMAAFTVTLLWIARTLRTSLLPIMLVLASMALAAGLIFSTAEPSRLTSLADERRATARETAWNAVTSRGVGEDLVGMGYGSLWPWYMTDMEMTGLISLGHDMESTQYGWTVFQPHSELLLLGVELGVVGILFLVKLWSTLAGLFLRSLARSGNAIFGCGVVITSLAMFGDLIIFKNFKTSWMWWFFVFAALSKTVESGERIDSQAPREAALVEEGVLQP